MVVSSSTTRRSRASTSSTRRAFVFRMWFRFSIVVTYLPAASPAGRGGHGLRCILDPGSA